MVYFRTSEQRTKLFLFLNAACSMILLAPISRKGPSILSFKQICRGGITGSLCSKLKHSLDLLGGHHVSKFDELQRNWTLLQLLELKQLRRRCNTFTRTLTGTATICTTEFYQPKVVLLMSNNQHMRRHDELWGNTACSIFPLG